MKVQAKIKLTNREKDPQTILLEPWAEEIVLLEGETAYLTAVGPEPLELEIETTDSKMVIYGWTGSICELFKDPVD